MIRSISTTTNKPCHKIFIGRTQIKSNCWSAFFDEKKLLQNVLVNSQKNKNPYTPCKPETISTTSSYTMRVAALSGRRSRLIEENTGTQTNIKSTRVHYIQRPSINSQQDEKLPGHFTDHYQTKRLDKASWYIFNRLAFIPPAAADTSRPGELHSFPLPSFLPFTSPLFGAGKRVNPIGCHSVGS